MTLFIVVAKTPSETLKTCLIGTDILGQPRVCLCVCEWVCVCVCVCVCMCV